MLEDENFWNWVMLHNGAIIKDKEGNKITSIKAEELARNYKISADFIEIEKLVKKKVAKQEELVRRYGKIIEMVFKEMLTKYPAMVFPQSLLPAPKEEIKSALLESIDSLEYTNYSQDEKNAISSQLKFALSFLDRFTDDNEANEENNKILNNRAYQQALQKRRR
jgi:predicted glutamine amidotransferase